MKPYACDVTFCKTRGRNVTSFLGTLLKSGFLCITLNKNDAVAFLDSLGYDICLLDSY